MEPKRYREISPHCPAPQMALKLGIYLALCGMSPRRVKRLREFWNARLNKAMGVDEETRKNFTTEQIREGLKTQGEGCRDEMREILREQKRYRRQNLQEEGLVFAGGVGNGDDIDFLRETMEAGLLLRWFDVSDAGIEVWQEYLKKIWPILQAAGITYPEPLATRAEIRNVLLQLEIFGIHLRRVRAWYFSGLFGYTPLLTANIGTYTMGRSMNAVNDPRKQTTALIGDVFTSKYNTETILANMERGAGRPLLASEKTCPFFKSTFTVLRVRAK